MREIKERRKVRWVRIIIPLIKIIIMIIRGIFAKSLRTGSKGNPNVACLAYKPSIISLKLLQSFCIKQQDNKIDDQLSNYEQYLVKFNESLKKPHNKLKNEESRIIEKYLTEKRYSSIVPFLHNNKNRSLCDVNTASKIDMQISKNWEILSQKDQIAAASALCHFRQDKTFQVFKRPIEQKLKQKGIESIQPQKLIIYLHGELINKKSLRFLSKLLPKDTSNDRLAIYDKIYKYIDKKQYRGVFLKQKKDLLHYLGLLIDPTLNKRQEIPIKKQRSPLQVTIESFLSVINAEFQRQVKINNFNIDYLIKLKNQSKIQEFIVQLNGNYHYTLTKRLKGKEILRNLIINEYAPLRIIHHQDFIISKGHRNKLAYIESLFKEKGINWEAQNRGLNSHWQVVADEALTKPYRE